MALSKRQIWRKTKVVNQKSCNALFSVVTFTRLKGSSNERVVDAYSDTYTPYEDDGTQSVLPAKLKSSLSTSSLKTFGEKKAKETKKQPLRFSRTVKVCLIPTRLEIKRYGNSLYWKAAECDRFKREAIFEIRSYLEKEDVSTKEAIRALYQPDGDMAEKTPTDSAVDDNFTDYTMDIGLERNDTFNLAGRSGASLESEEDREASVPESVAEEEAAARLAAAPMPAPFLSLKTDVELNLDAEEQCTAFSTARVGDGSMHLPTKTPAFSAQSPGEQQVWMVQWKKAAQETGTRVQRPVMI